MVTEVGLSSQESLTLVQQLACATYVAAGTGLLAMWAFGSSRPEPPALMTQSTVGCAGPAR
jgi:hypothetical protein